MPDSDLKPTIEELSLYDEISGLGRDLWQKSKQIEGLNTDPKMMSIMLFKRLWSNHRGYTLLWNNSFPLESDIVLRSGIEAAICIAANQVLKDKFVLMMKSDAAFSLLGQIRIHREFGGTDLVRDGEATLRTLKEGLPDETKPKKLDWADLADTGNVPQLYQYHRMLSGVSSHVTGLSVLKGVVSDGDSEGLQNELTGLTRKMHLMMMAGATLNGSLRHAGMIEDEQCAANALTLTEKMNAVSFKWPGVED